MYFQPGDHSLRSQELNSSPSFLAIDLGAESGRTVLGRWQEGAVQLQEVHRFRNEPVRLPSGLHWDVLRIFQEVKHGIALAAREVPDLSSIGIDAWGVDYGLLDSSGALLGNPYHYRDSRTQGMYERAFERASQQEIYQTTGIQFMPINTVYQLLAMENSPQLQIADSLLTIPDLLNYWLTGVKRSEYTIASTSQLLDASGRDWAAGLISKLGLPLQILPPLIEPGRVLGGLLPDIAVEVGLPAGLPVVAVASHDTASAVVAVPAEENTQWAYISSGTWSLVGIESDAPVMTPEAMEANFTNEGGFGGKVRLLKNVMGLWILQECRSTWARQGHDLSYEEIARLAAEAPPGGPLVDPDDPGFLPPGDMPARIRQYCDETQQRPPAEPGGMARCVLESLALKYRWVLERLQGLAGTQFDTVHVVGGGVRNELLCRFTAGVTGLPVLAGPTEATALGNVLVQAHAFRLADSLAQLRSVARSSSEIRCYQPEGEWENTWQRFQSIVRRG